MVVCLEHLNIYTDGSKIDSGVGSEIYSGKLDLSIFLRLTGYCSVLMRRRWPFTEPINESSTVNGAPFIRVSVSSHSQAAISSLSGFVNNSRIIRECHRCLDLLFERFSVSLVE